MKQKKLKVRKSYYNLRVSFTHNEADQIKCIQARLEARLLLKVSQTAVIRRALALLAREEGLINESIAV